MTVQVSEKPGIESIRERLGPHASLLDHRCGTIDRERLQLPGPDFVDRVFTPSDRPVPVNCAYQ